MGETPRPEEELPQEGARREGYDDEDITCAHCGAKVQGGLSICPHCGAGFEPSPKDEEKK